MSGSASPSGVGTARGQALASAALFSVGGAVIKATDFSALQVAGYRAAAAALALLAMGACFPRLRPRIHRSTWLVAIPYAGTMLLFVLGNKLTTAANMIFLHNTAPLYLLLLGPWLLGERWGRRDLGVMLALGLGLGLCVAGAGEGLGVGSTAPDPRTGNWVAAGAGFCWALTVLGLRWLAADRGEGGSRGGQGSEALGAVVAGNLVTVVVALPFAGSGVRGGVTDWWAVLFLGLFQIAGAYLLLTAAIRRLAALELSMLLLLEPVLSPIWAWLVHDERPAALALLGGFVILTAIAVRAILDSRQHRPAMV